MVHKIALGIGRPASREHHAVAEYVLAPLNRAELAAAELNTDTGKSGELVEAAWRHVCEVAVELQSEETTASAVVFRILENTLMRCDI